MKYKVILADDEDIMIAAANEAAAQKEELEKQKANRFHSL